MRSRVPKRRRSMTAADALHRIAFRTLAAGVYWHVYGVEYGALMAHPASRSRLALVDGFPPGVIVRPTFYIGWTPDVALWEGILRNVRPMDGAVSLLSAWTAGRGLARIRLQRDLQVIALDHPARRDVIDYDSPEDERWHGHLTTHHYKRTHLAAAALDAQCRAAGCVLPGIRWHSRQLQADLIAVLYSPTFASADWVVEEKFELDSVAGRQAIAAALARANMRQFDDLHILGGLPPADECL